MRYKTEQEKFWAESFGSDYVDRNNGNKLLATNLSVFSKILKCCGNIKTCIEFGSNVGLNLKALKLLMPDTDFSAIEINKKATEELSKILNPKNIFNTSILDWNPQKQYDLVLISGVLIHINPDYLDKVYKVLYKSSNKYILINEYYNPKPVMIEYRGYKDRLFKRDFAGEILDSFSDLNLVDYGFVYHRDNYFPNDDTTWFLLQKT